MKNNRPIDTSPFPDLVTPTAELATSLIEMGSKFAWKLTAKAFNKRAALEPLEFNLLRSKKKALFETSLGYSINSKRELPFKEISFDKHSFIVGAAGFGKTNLLSLLQEYDLQEGRPVIFFDPKGDLEALTNFRNLCEKYKRTCHIFSEHYPEAIKINPLKDGSINQIVDRIMTSFDWGEPFYKDLAYNALVYVVKEIKERREVVSFSKIASLIESYPHAKPEQIMGLKTKIQKITQSDYAPLLEDDGGAWGLDQIRKSKACLYLGLSTQGYGETAMGLGKVFLGDLLYQSYKQLTLTSDSHESMANAISVYFDEVGSLITPQFIELQNKCRGAGIRLTLACQSSADIDRVSPDLTKQVIENAANLFVFKQRVEDSVKFLSESIGTTPTIKKTYQTSDELKSGMGSEREANVLIVHSDLIKNLRVGQCILVRHGPTQVDLINLRDRRDDQKKKTRREKIIRLYRGGIKWRRVFSMILGLRKYFRRSKPGPSLASENSASLVKDMESATGR